MHSLSQWHFFIHSLLIDWASPMMMEIHQQFSPCPQRSYSPGHTDSFLWSCASRVFSYHKFGCLFPSYQNSFISLSLSLLGIIILAATTTFNYNISPFSLPFSQLQSTPLQSGITFLPLKGTCSSGRPEEPTHHFSSLCCIQKTPMNRLLGFIILPCSYT